MSAKLLAIINLVISIIVIAWNGYTGANGLNGNTVGGLSDSYNSLFTPAGYAFSIWGIIFIGLLLISIQLLRIAFGNIDKDIVVQTIAPTLILANLLNGAWLYAWLGNMPGISVLLMLGILVTLIATNIRNTALFRTNTEFRIMINCPLQVYMGWIIVATVANISAYLKHIGFDFMISESGWTILLLLIATSIVIKAHKDKFWPGIILVAIWAFVAIVIKQWGLNPTVSYAAIICSLILVLSVLGKKPTVFVPKVD